MIHLDGVASLCARTVISRIPKSNVYITVLLPGLPMHILKDRILVHLFVAKEERRKIRDGDNISVSYQLENVVSPSHPREAPNW